MNYCFPNNVPMTQFSTLIVIPRSPVSTGLRGICSLCGVNLSYIVIPKRSEGSVDSSPRQEAGARNDMLAILKCSCYEA